MQDKSSREVQKKQFEESNSDLDNFFSSASHELHTPLRHIKNFTELLSEHLLDSLDNQSRHYLDVISGSATELTVLIDQLLEWVKLDSVTVHFSLVDLNLLVSGAINSFANEIKDRNIEWDIGNLPEVCGDSAMLRTAFVCLVSNSLKSTRAQSVARIRIAVEPGLSQMNEIVISIKDNGNEFEGNGIGLATVQRIAQKHDGKVWAESEPEKETAVYLALGNYGQKS